VDVQELFSVRGKVALVTGGSRGIGLMIATGLVAGGARVYVAARKQAEVDAAVKELSASGDALGVTADLSSHAGTRALADEMASREPKLHVLVNNAGANWGAPLADYPEAGWDKVMALNVKAVFDLTRMLLARLEAAAAPGDPARVLNVGSIDGLQVPLLETYAYSASKAAVHHLTRVLARKLAPKVTVNAIAPGPFESKMMAETLRNFGEGIRKSCPMGRIGEPEDMAGVALYLASRAGAYVTGAVIPVDGGIATTK
jgi:NAD(P)-dependent dehydrogenase (short-subunit alcohol dehydrogenase family)